MGIDVSCRQFFLLSLLKPNSISDSSLYRDASRLYTGASSMSGMAAITFDAWKVSGGVMPGTLRVNSTQTKKSTHLADLS